jgi:hypothetical protein
VALCPKRPFLTYRKQLLAYNLSVKSFLTQNVERRTQNAEVENTIKCALAYSRQSEYYSKYNTFEGCPLSWGRLDNAVGKRGQGRRRLNG